MKNMDILYGSCLLLKFLRSRFSGIKSYIHEANKRRSVTDKESKLTKKKQRGKIVQLHSKTFRNHRYTVIIKINERLILFNGVFISREISYNSSCHAKLLWLSTNTACTGKNYICCCGNLS